MFEEHYNVVTPIHIEHKVIEDYTFRDDIIRTYFVLMDRCCDLNKPIIKREDILKKVYYYQQKGVMGWVVRGVCEMNRPKKPIMPTELYALLANEEMFMEQCRVLYKRVNKFKKSGFDINKIGEKID